MICKQIKLICSSLVVLGFVSACGGGSGLKAIAPVAIPPVVIPPVVNPPTESELCINEHYPIVIASDDGSFTTPYAPERVIDEDTSPDSRWSSAGVSTSLILDIGALNTVGALKIKWYRGADQVATFKIETSANNSTWDEVLASTDSSGRHSGFELINVATSDARYVKIVGLGNSVDDSNGIVEVQVHKCENADGEIVAAYPNELGIELLDWYLSVPTDEDNSGTSDSIFENKLAAGYTNSEYFYASADNGIVMRSPSYGFKTSVNTNYVRVELREMLRRGDNAIRTQGVNKNNWVFGSASTTGKSNAGGVDGELNVTLAVNQVTTTGENYQIGRLVIGQIHANDDEPIRLYYRKLPNNEFGSIYFAHESRVEDSAGKNIESYVEMIGSRSNSASNPADGIGLNEKFSYRIEVIDNSLSATIMREGKANVTANFDMSESLYGDDGQYQYFKVGVYHLNNSSNPSEYAQATFYEIRNSHTGYADSE